MPMDKTTPVLIVDDYKTMLRIIRNRKRGKLLGAAVAPGASA